MANKRIDEPTGTQTVGHEWDGIEELDTPLPRWWLWTYYASILFAIGYVIAYPAWPLLEKGTVGVIGWTSRGQLAKDTSKADAALAGLRAQLASTPIEDLTDNKELMAQAVAGGHAAFKVNCIQCHGAGAAGSQTLGYPNLNDDDWLWGGDLKAIEQTLIHGIRQHGDEQTRTGRPMPAFAGAIEGAKLDALTGHVLSLSGKAKANATGAALYAENCALCHGTTGEGDRAEGFPALNDAIWLYGGSREAIKRQIAQPRAGMMPAWGERLDPVTIRMLAAYVHSLGGGEDSAEDAEAPQATDAGN